jgi:hypothetical protein
MGDKITMSQKEIARISTLTKILDGQMKQTDAAKLLNITARHINRLFKEAKKTSIIEALVHKNRGKSSKRKISEFLEQNITELYKTKYCDFGPTFFQEKLFEEHNIDLSNETLRKILIKNDLWKTRKYAKKTCHIWREPKHHFGELIQFDGSHHRWLENRLNQEFCLMVFIDDATGEKFARFYEYEGTFPALASLKLFIEKYGIPKAIYCDKHSTYLTTRSQNLDEQLQGEYPKTQFAKALEKLEIELIFAQSPQAKGRVERANKLFQDRLVKEMRLANINTITDANKFLENIFLPKINKKFNKLPKSKVSFFKPLPAHLNLDLACSLSFERTVCNDFTIHWQNRVFLILERTYSLKQTKIIIKQFLDGSLHFFSKDKILTVEEITEKFNKIIVKNKFEIAHFKNLEIHQNSKNSWMDNLYIGTNVSFSN